MVLFGASAGGQWLGRRLAPGAQTPEQERERESFRAELDAIYERHPNDHAAREAERERLFERPTPPQVSLWRAVAPPLAAGLATTLLRRRLAPTVEVVAKGQSP
jgi:hypothetical protein